MNDLISLVPHSATQIIGYGILVFLAFAAGYWIFARIFENWHPAFKVVVVLGILIVPLSTKSASDLLFATQCWVGIVVRLGLPYYRQMMSNRNMGLF